MNKSLKAICHSSSHNRIRHENFVDTFLATCSLWSPETNEFLTDRIRSDIAIELGFRLDGSVRPVLPIYLFDNEQVPGEQ
jgi:hypothetical protein